MKKIILILAILMSPTVYADENVEVIQCDVTLKAGKNTVEILQGIPMNICTPDVVDNITKVEMDGENKNWIMKTDNYRLVRILNPFESKGIMYSNIFMDNQKTPKYQVKLVLY